MLYAQDRWAVLLIFQAMDAGGKDGAIKHVMSGVNPQGCQVYSFKAPSSEDLDHDFSWRCLKCLPERGRIGIFNRSYYEETLVVRVHSELLRKSEATIRTAHQATSGRSAFRTSARIERYLSRNGVADPEVLLSTSRRRSRTKRFLERFDIPGEELEVLRSDAQERGYWNELSWRPTRT